MSSTTQDYRAMQAAQQAEEQAAERRAMLLNNARALLEGKTLVCACWMGRGTYTITRTDVTAPNGVADEDILNAVIRRQAANAAQRAAATEHLNRVVTAAALRLLENCNVIAERVIH